MPTILTHAAVPITLAVCASGSRVPVRLAVAGMILAMLPDLDVIGFKFGIAYADPWGHRGASHSLVWSGAMALLVGALWREFRSAFALGFLFLAAASHGLLDMLTDGGLGVAVWWPFATVREFFPLTPIRVSPIGAGFFSMRGLETLLSEIVWVWLPCGIIAMSAIVGRRVSQGNAD